MGATDLTKCPTWGELFTKVEYITFTGSEASSLSPLVLTFSPGTLYILALSGMQSTTLIAQFDNYSITGIVAVQLYAPQMSEASMQFKLTPSASSGPTISAGYRRTMYGTGEGIFPNLEYRNMVN